jgi:hypothetical protein
MSEDLALLIDGVAHSGLIGANITYSASRAVRSLTASLSEMPPLTRAGQSARLLCASAGSGWGGAAPDLLVDGWVRRTSGTFGKQQLARKALIESKPCDPVESAAKGRQHGYRLGGVSLGEAAKTLFAPFGVKVSVKDDSAKIDIPWRPGDRAFDVIEGHARKHGLLLAATPDGVELFRGSRGRHDGRFILGGPGANVVGIDYSDSEIGRFSETEAVGQRWKSGAGRDETAPYATATDPYVSRFRPDIVPVEHDADRAELRKRAEWEARRAAGGEEESGTTIKVMTSFWRDDAGKIWEPGYVIPVYAPDAEIDQDMVLKSVTLDWSKIKVSAILMLCDPRALGGDDPGGKSGKAWAAPSKPAEYGEDEE